MNITVAKSALELGQIKTLFLEYETFLGINLSFQGFEQELQNLPGMYSPPDGALLLAFQNEMSLGCGAIRRFGSIEINTCEMKRLYVKPSARGHGLGRKIAQKLIQIGRESGYKTMVLDTLDRLTEAKALYQSLGFIQIPPYYDNPLPGVTYWELNL
jgi:ribosomal protein S18 acetylase RimI-like enzyme